MVITATAMMPSRHKNALHTQPGQSRPRLLDRGNPATKATQKLSSRSSRRIAIGRDRSPPEMTQNGKWFRRTGAAAGLVSARPRAEMSLQNFGTAGTPGSFRGAAAQA
jgi:hypothetical protein